MMQLQRVIASEKDITVIARYYKKKFAREARWEAAKERLIRICLLYTSDAADD